MKKNLRHILIGVVVILLGTLSALVIADTVNQEKQILVDGDMENAGVGDWADYHGTSSKETGAVEDGSQVLRISYLASYVAGWTKQLITTSGETYRFTGWARSDGNARPQIINGISPEWTGVNTHTNWQYFDFTVTWTQTFGLYLGSDQLDTGYYVEFDDILVTEYTPPIANAESEVLIDGDMEEDGTDIAFIKKFDLTQAANITADSGSITGALTYTCAGADFDGTNDYVTYIIPSTLFSTNPSMSIVVEFTPDFAFDENVEHYLINSSGSAYRFIKRDNASGNNLAIYFGTGGFRNIAPATYSAYWNQDARNVLVVSGTSGDTNVWLNGTQIVTNDADAWTPASPTTLTVGATSIGGSKFDGEIHAVSIYSGLLDGTDATNLYNSDDTSDWTAGSSACLTKQLGGAESGSQILRVAYGGENSGFAYKSLEIGKKYKYSLWARSDGNSRAGFRVGSYLHWGTNLITTWEYLEGTFTADATLMRLNTTIEAGEYVEFDDILITEYTPPMVNDYSQGLADGDMEIAGVASWTAGNSATLSKEAGAVEDGTQVLRVTYNGTSFANATQTIVESGKTYRVTGWMRGDGGTALPRIRVGGTFGASGTTSTDWQRIDETLVSAGTTVILYQYTTGAGYAEFDDVLVTEL